MVPKTLLGSVVLVFAIYTSAKVQVQIETLPGFRAMLRGGCGGQWLITISEPNHIGLL